MNDREVQEIITKRDNEWEAALGPDGPKHPEDVGPWLKMVIK